MMLKDRKILCERCESVGREPRRATIRYELPSGTVSFICKQCYREVTTEDIFNDTFLDVATKTFIEDEE